MKGCKKPLSTSDIESARADMGYKNEKIAAMKYKTCLKEIKKAKNESEVRRAIVIFLEAINELSGMETSEREDAAIAVRQLIESSALGIPQETGEKWFDEIRDF